MGQVLGNCQGGATCVTALLLCVREGSQRGQCCCLASGILPGRKLCPTHTSLSPHVPHWYTSSCCSGAKSQRGWVCMSPKSIVGPIRGCSFFHHPNSHWFSQPEVMGTYLPGAGTLGWVVWTGAGILLS